jgi:hypothetical protein
VGACWIFTAGINHPPGKPWIKGPPGTPVVKSLSGAPIIKSLSSAKPLPRPLPKPGTYNYTFKAIDPDGHDIYYYVEWGDGTNSEWIGPYLSGQEITRSHTWVNMGTYCVRARAKDIYGAKGDWGTIPIEIS